MSHTGLGTFRHKLEKLFKSSKFELVWLKVKRKLESVLKTLRVRFQDECSMNVVHFEFISFGIQSFFVWLTNCKLQFTG